LFAAYKKPDAVPGDGKNTVKCSYDRYPGEKVCYVDPEDWGACSSANNYNYHIAAPCIFLKLNKVSQE
jgi:hypothetical protein